MSEMTFTTLRNYPHDRKQTPHHSLRLYDYVSPSRIFTPISTLTPHIMFTLTSRSLMSVWNDSEFACMIPGIIGGTLFFISISLAISGYTLFLYYFFRFFLVPSLFVDILNFFGFGASVLVVSGFSVHGVLSRRD
jgi:hypothetical protein